MQVAMIQVLIDACAQIQRQDSFFFFCNMDAQINSAKGEWCDVIMHGALDVLLFSCYVPKSGRICPLIKDHRNLGLVLLLKLNVQSSSNLLIDPCLYKPVQIFCIDGYMMIFHQINARFKLYLFSNMLLKKFVCSLGTVASSVYSSYHVKGAILAFI